jgi:hypothetical protein
LFNKLGNAQNWPVDHILYEEDNNEKGVKPPRLAAFHEEHPLEFSHLCQEIDKLNVRWTKVSSLNNQIQLLETVIERLPQSVLQISLFIARYTCKGGQGGRQAGRQVDRLTGRQVGG